MRSPVHIIKAQEFQIVYDDPGSAHRLQTSISGLQDARIDPLLDQILDKFSTDDYVYQFDTIELDLGSVTASNYENEMIFRIEETLTAYLSATIYDKGKLRDGISIATNYGLLEHLEHYLEKGHFQWNSNPDHTTSQLLEDLIKTKPDELRQMLRRTGKLSRTRKRMIFQFSDHELDEIVRLVAKQDGEYMIAYKDNVLEYQKEHSVIESPQSAVKSVVWEIVLAYLFAENKSYYDKRSFLQYLIEKMSSKYNLDYAQLLNTLSKVVESSPQLANKTSEFSKLISDLTSISMPQLESGKHKEKTVDKNLWLRELGFYLERGNFRPDAQSYSRSKFNEELLKRLKSNDRELIRSLDSWLIFPEKARRLMDIIQSPSLNEIVDKSEIPSLKIARDFLVKLHSDGEFTDTSKRFLEKVNDKRGELLIKLPLSRNYSEKKQLHHLLRNMLIISREKEDSIIQLLMEVKPALSDRYQQIVSEFLMSFYRNMGKVVLEGISDEIRSFTLSNPRSFWLDWVKEKMTGWSRATKLSPEKILRYVAVNLRGTNAPDTVQVFIEKARQFTNSEEEKNLPEIKGELPQRRQNEILYLFEHGKLPWWIEAAAFWNNFNEEFGHLWAARENRTRLIGLLKKQQKSMALVSFLEETHYHSLLLEIAGAKGREKVLFLNTFRQFVYHNLLPLGGISQSQYQGLKKSILGSLLVTEQNDWTQLIRMIKNWNGNTAIESKQSLTNALDSMLENLAGKLTHSPAKKSLEAWRNELPVRDRINKTTSINELLLPLVSDPYLLNDSAQLLGELHKMIAARPASFDILLKNEQLRQHLIEVLPTPELDNLINVKLGTRQKESFRQALLHLERYKGYLSEQDFTKTRKLFSERVLLQLSMNGMQSWGVKEWGRLIYHTLNVVVGKSKHRSILFRIKDKVSYDHGHYRNGNLRFISQLNELVDESSEQVLAETKKIFKEMVGKPRENDSKTENSLEQSFEERAILLDSHQRQMHRQSIHFLENIKHHLSIREIKELRLLLTKILNLHLDRSTLRSWRANDWGALIYHSMSEVLGASKNIEIQAKIATEKRTENLRSLTTGESVLGAIRSIAESISEKEKKETRKLFDESFEQLKVRDQLQKNKIIKQEIRQIEHKLHSSQVTYFGQALSHINSYKPHITSDAYSSIRRLVSKFLLLKLEESDLSNWGMKEWGHLLYHSMNEVMGAEKNEEVRAKIREQLDIETEIEINESEQLVNELAALASEIPTAELQDPTHAEQDKPYKKLGETIEREYLDPIFINNAGLIILAPFLAMLFERCGLMEASKFKDETSKYRAVQLLSYAATGQAIMEEHDLVINKVLCGLDLMAPLDRIRELSSSEKGTVDGLLTAVTQQWTPMKETSIEALRDTFLKRPGKLVEEESFYLKVEQRSYDMLLDRIPWNIAKIKLSWMKKILEVEWKT